MSSRRDSFGENRGANERAAVGDVDQAEVEGNVWSKVEEGRNRLV